MAFIRRERKPLVRSSCKIPGLTPTPIQSVTRFCQNKASFLLKSCRSMAEFLNAFSRSVKTVNNAKTQLYFYFLNYEHIHISVWSQIQIVFVYFYALFKLEHFFCFLNFGNRKKFEATAFCWTIFLNRLSNNIDNILCVH